jgi:hypothetical protein
MIERWRPRSVAGARSTAAYRACKPAAVPPPKRKKPVNRSGIELRTAAVTTTSAPTAATR